MNIYLKIFLIVSGIIVLICIVSVMFIFKKEKYQKYWYALIPFYGAIKYLKICKLPYWTLFIPFINVLTFIFSTYCIAKQYSCSQFLCILAIPFPFIVLPYIACANKKNKNIDIEFNYLKNNKDIDELEKNLSSLNDDLVDSREFLEIDNSLGTFPEKNDEVSIDEYIPDEEIYLAEDNLVESDSNDIIELEDMDEDDNFNYETIDTIENNLKSSSKTEIDLISNKNLFNENQASEEAIAFGGEKKMEHVPKAKVEELKCDRCGSSLVGANGFCPGCGKQL